MGVIDSILEHPSAWTGERVVDEVALRMYHDPRRSDPGLPTWLGALIALCDFDAHVQMEGLLGWWENAASRDLDLVVTALRAVGLPEQAALLGQAALVLEASTLNTSIRPEGSISTFGERHPEVTRAQYEEVAHLEKRLRAITEDPAGLYAALVRHANRGLARLA